MKILRLLLLFLFAMGTIDAEYAKMAPFGARMQSVCFLNATTEENTYFQFAQYCHYELDGRHKARVG